MHNYYLSLKVLSSNIKLYRYFKKIILIKKFGSLDFNYYLYYCHCFVRYIFNRKFESLFQTNFLNLTVFGIKIL